MSDTTVVVSQSATSNTIVNIDPQTGETEIIVVAESQPDVSVVISND